jgi:hypothetical protein
MRSVTSLSGVERVEGDGDPVAFVEVVARCDCWVGGAELFAEFGVAFDADAERGFVERAEREHLGAGFEDGELWAERELLTRVGEVEAEIA